MLGKHSPYPQQPIYNATDAVNSLALGWNIGMVIPRDVLVLDVDDGDINDYPETFTVKTGKGFHLYYYVNKLYPSVPIKTGVDVFTYGKYITIPFSLHRNGKRYSIYKEQSLYELNNELNKRRKQ